MPLHGPRAAAKARTKSADEIYINQVLNNRFKVESKIGEGGFGAVYRGVQLATGRKVALKLLHPEMTKDDNLVARFRREGMVLCNLRDAHTITTYDFDQTPDGTLYIAMELLEGKSLHQIFHEEAPLAWRRVFKILTEMCSSLAEAHAQGIVHRDLKPENIYLETRPGNPEFVKILDFGIAKVMRGDTIDPQSPQLTATGQTLGTLEYMSPEQLMGKPLDGRSDVYALGVLAYEMITGRLPFPDAKGPAGLITAQLKQTPLPPSQASPGAGLPKEADRAILRCLEKDKNNRFPDVSALAAALQDVVTGRAELAVGAAVKPPAPVAANHDRGQAIDRGAAAPRPVGPRESPRAGAAPADILERRGAMPGPAVPQAAVPKPAVPPAPVAPLPGVSEIPRMPGAPGWPALPATGLAGDPSAGLAQMTTQLAPGPAPSSHGAGHVPGPLPAHAAAIAPTQVPLRGPAVAPAPLPGRAASPPVMTPPAGSQLAPRPMTPTPYPPPGSLLQGGPSLPIGTYPQAAHYPALPRSSKKLVWWVIALLAIGAAVGTALALVFTK